MALLKRLSDGFWSYVSPRKSTSTPTSAPQPPPQSKTVAQPTKPALLTSRASIKEVIKHTRSMSPAERVDTWKLGSSEIKSARGYKRKCTSSESIADHRLKSAKMATEDEGDLECTPAPSRKTARVTVKEETDMDYAPAVDYEGDTLMDDKDGDEDTDLASSLSNIRVAHSPSPSQHPTASPPSSDIALDSTLVVSESEYQLTTPRKRLLSLPTTQSQRHVSRPELLAAGWSDSHITLVQKIAMRGLEPLLPQYWAYDLRQLPDALFAPHPAGHDNNGANEAFVSCIHTPHAHGVRALEKLFELGGRVRDALLKTSNTSPEQAARRSIQEYEKWALRDSGLHPRSAISLLAIEIQPKGTSAEVLQLRAERKLEGLRRRWEEALTAEPTARKSRPSPKSASSTRLVRPIPQLYAFIASHTLIALVAYRPDLAVEVGEEASTNAEGGASQQAEAGDTVRPVAFFDMKNPDYDVWNALAIACVVCHVRNIQAEIAEEIGLGVRKPGEEKDDDPDA